MNNIEIKSQFIMKKVYISTFIAVLAMLFVHQESFGAEKPYLGAIPDQIASLGELFTLDVDAQFADPPETYELTDARPGMSINPSTGLISWTPVSASDGGVVTVRAFNSQGEAVRSFLIYITDAVVCSDDLISYWKMDDVSPTSMEDFKGGHTMTSLTPLGTDATAKVGTAKTFAPLGALDQFATVADNGQYDFPASGGFSISMWIKYDGQYLGYENNQVLLARGNPNPDGEEMYMLLMVKIIDGAPRLSWSLKPSYSEDWKETYSTTVIPTGQWVHVSAVYQGAPPNGTAWLKTYVNKVKGQNSHVWHGTNFDGKNSADMNVGYWSLFGANQYPFNGSMDEILIYNKALTDIDVTNIYNDGMAGEAHCKPGNYFPLISSTPITSVVQDADYSYTFTAQDYEGDPLVLSAVTIPDFLSFSTSSGLLAGTPDYEDVGDHTIKLMASDGNTDIYQEYILTVENVNDPPEFTSVPETSAMENVAYTYFIVAEDPDDDVLTYTAPVLPTWLTFNPTAKTLIGIPMRANAGDNPVKIVVSDGTVEIAQEFVINVVSDNNAPLFTSNPPTIVDNYSEYMYTVTAYDADAADVLVFAAETIPDWASFDMSTQILSGIPEKADVGDHSVVLTVTDGYDLVQQEFVITVRDVNTSPVVISEPSSEAKVDRLYTYLMEVIDNDGDPLTYSGIVIPDWLTFNTASKVLSGTPVEADLGESNVIISVSDGMFTVNHQFIITVVPEWGVGIDLTNALVSKVFPNPARSVVNFEFSGEVSLIEITDLAGRVMIHQSVENGNMSIQLDVSELSEGVYLFRAIDGDQQQTGKIIIK